MFDSGRLLARLAVAVPLLGLASCGLSTGPSWSVEVVYVTNSGSNNISAYQANPSSGALVPVAGSPFSAGRGPIGAPGVNTGWAAYVPNSGDNTLSVYSINDTAAARNVDATTGALAAVTGSPFATGSRPVAVAVDFSSRAAYVVNNAGNDISVYTGDVYMRALTPVAGSPFATGLAPISVTLGPAVYVVNNGSNNISAFTVDASTHALTAIAGSPFASGSGPADLEIDPLRKFAFVANSASGDVSAYVVGPAGALAAVAGSPFAAGTNPVSVSIWNVGMGGEFVYVLNRGSDDISAYEVDAAMGVLTPVAGSPFPTGGSPNSLSFDPTRRFVYVTNGGSGSISGYAINATTGALTALRGSPYPAGTNPKFMAFNSNGTFAYVANSGSDNISAYAIDAVGGTATPGVLTAVPGSPFPAGVSPDAVSTLKIACCVL
jgi:6-phosphogluconolactonase